MKSNKIILATLLSLTYFTHSAYINVPAGLPGITSLFAFSPETAKPMRELAEVLLRRESTLSAGERELIAAYVSRKNECVFCCSSHSAAAKHLLVGDDTLINAVLDDMATAPISDKMKALLTIAGDVQQGGLYVTEEHVAQARTYGATDKEIHDTVLIAAAFCMFNRYVDGLRAQTPTDPQMYDIMGKGMAEFGYIRPRN